MKNRNPLGAGNAPVVCLLSVLFIVGCVTRTGSPDVTEDGEGDVIDQVATLNSLLAGKYGGAETDGHLMRRGTFGLGIVDRLDGEMIGVNGTAYVIRDNGTADKLNEETRLPFGVVTPFEVDTTLTFTYVSSFADLQSRLDEKLPSTGRLYAFRIAGAFEDPDPQRERTTSPVPST